MKNYIVLIGDLIDSRKLENRESVQENILDIFNAINKEYADNIVSKFTLTIGDEFQAILDVDSKVFDIINNLQYSDLPDFRLGIGFGQINTKINREISIGADGPVFWHAREAINTVHSNNWNGKCDILFMSDDEKMDKIINSLILSSELIRKSWTVKQTETYLELIQLEDKHNFKQKDLANKMQISEASLSKRLNSANIKEYLEIRSSIDLVLEEYYGSTK